MRERFPRGRLLSFGCPDALWEDPAVPVSPFADAIRRCHKYKGNPLDVVALFRAHGWEMTALDVVQSRGFERTFDLNDPLPADLIGQFDAVLDGGTVEHVFNVGQGFRNALLALRVGGVVMHDSPLVFCNHGFWSVQPTAMLDFYGQNGCSVETWVRNGPELRPIDWRRFAAPADKSQTLGIATKLKEVPFAWPTQARFLQPNAPL